MYIFNPENDLALANFSPHFTAPRSARKMRDDLALLPVWYAPDGAVVVANEELNSGFLRELKNKLPIDKTLIPLSQLSETLKAKVNPWGWSPSLRRELIQYGMKEDWLPSLKQIGLIRNYSNRQNAVKLLKELKESNSSYCGFSYYYTTISELLSYLSKTRTNQVLKMPLSGSGKGIVWLRGAITDKQTDWCRRVIKMQGGIVAEPVLNKAQDFAMEFEMSDEGVLFVGYSLFESASSGAYLGNLLLSDEDIEGKLSTYIERKQLLELKETLTTKLCHYFPHYRGYLGVDMMICKIGEAAYQLHPCVEVNMRMNMGMVAHRIHEQFVHPNSTGLFSIDFFKQGGEAQNSSLAMKHKKPLVIEDGRIKSGHLGLTPIDKETRYTATIAIKDKSREE